MALILNVDDGESIEVAHGGLFEARVTPLAEKLGARLIGANVTAIPAGKAA
jgi:antitoxin (DNA-binding transcriptional repressor) of toxin-antitoxin stability system